MSQDFMRTNSPALEKIVTETLTGEVGSFEAMKDALRLQLGIASPSEEVPEIGNRPASSPAPIVPVASAGPQNCIRVIYPGGNARFEIYSDSEEGLDLQEQWIRA